jgi:hypothetical protein
MLAKLLDQLGLFLGHQVEKNHEAVYFLFLNNLLLSESRASWDNPAPLQDFLKNRDAVDMTVRCLEADILSYRMYSYLGLRQYLRYRSLPRFDKPWGWKDPRNVFTLPLWLKIFPNAKIIYVVRNGVDVARSLVVRERMLLAHQKKKFEGQFDRFSRRTRLERVGFNGSIVCSSLEGSFSLWEQYVSQAEALLASIENDRLVIKYEDFLQNAVSRLSALVRFCGLAGVSQKTIGEAAEWVDVRRANTFISDPVLNRFHHTVKTSRWMVRYGYAGDPMPSDFELSGRQFLTWREPVAAD